MESEVGKRGRTGDRMGEDGTESEENGGRERERVEGGEKERTEGRDKDGAIPMVGPAPCKKKEGVGI